MKTQSTAKTPWSELNLRLRHMRWKWLWNFGSSAGYLFTKKSIIPEAAALLDTLHRDGIATLASPFDPNLFEIVQAEALRLFERNWDEEQRRPKFELDMSKTTTGETNEFVRNLLPSLLEDKSPFMQYALHPFLISVANGYLGLRSRLRALELWLNFPTVSDAKSTQLWHRDADDFMNIKVMTHLKDIDLSSGPFCFIPGTQPFGSRNIHPKMTPEGRSLDQDMENLVSRSQWYVGVGKAGTTAFVDTCGYHKGEKPTRNPRLMLMCHYVSARSPYPRAFKIKGPLSADWSVEQRAALDQS